MTLSVLTERRVNSPPGLAGGCSAQRGRNTLQRADGRRINLGPKTAVPVYPGVRRTVLSSKQNISLCGIANEMKVYARLCKLRIDI